MPQQIPEQITVTTELTVVQPAGKTPLVPEQTDVFGDDGPTEEKVAAFLAGVIPTVDLAEKLDDQRMKQLAYRLIYLEQPDALPGSMRQSFDDRVAERLLTDDPVVPWRTIPKALQETEDLMSSSDSDDLKRFYQKVRQCLEDRGGTNVP